MKPSRTSRAWSTWLALPGVVRIAAVILLLVLVGLALPARADLIASNGSDSVRLAETACSREEVLKRLTPRFREVMRDATALVGGETYRACWIRNGDSVHLLYEDGDQGIVPLADFKRDDGA